MARDDDDLATRLVRRRGELRIAQREAGKLMGVCKATVWQWENRRAVPEDRFYPKIIEFLGHEPWPEVARLSQMLRAERRRRGVTIHAAASMIDVSHGAFHNWELGINRPSRAHQEKVDLFLAGLPVTEGNAIP